MVNKASQSTSYISLPLIMQYEEANYCTIEIKIYHRSKLINVILNRLESLGEHKKRRITRCVHMCE